VATSYYYRQGEGDQSKGFSRIYFFERANGSWEKAPYLSFGESAGGPWGQSAGALSLDGSGASADSLAVGQAGSDSGFMSGAVSIYRRAASGWELEDTLTAADGEGMSGFGSSIALKGSRLLVGAGMVSDDAYWDGVAYLFTLYQGRWVDQLRITPSDDGGLGDFFGSKVDISNDTLLIAAPNEFGNAVYVYKLGAR
jgi:hypothetical protein